MNDQGNGNDAVAVVDRIVAIDRGRQIAEGDPHEVMASEAVQAVYLGAME